ncbi:hypothetical protein CYMTET_4319 [Cymbomonas tetramitiformis]|uniref:Uncharacterized protein n=1 Tax=Cymbomonas tetramitiformis TaxID=36881 RepID=A0AAE0LKL5_9CHLO|nr:hypothetical protein CYMTET_4319 [Cymbomonas tetramitiformis]
MNPPPNPLPIDPVPIWGSPAVRAALHDCNTFFPTVRSTRWSRVTAEHAQDGLSQHFGPLRAAFRESIPPVVLPDLPALTAAGTSFLVADPTAASTFSMPAQWKIVPPLPAPWGPVKAAAEASWKLVGRILDSVQTYSANLPVAPVVPVVQAGPVDPVLALMQQQLAQQQANHEAAMAVLRQTVDAQQQQLIAAAAAAAVVAAPPVSPELRALIVAFESAPLFVEEWPLECLDVLTAVLQVHATRLSGFLVAAGTAHFGLDPLVKLRPAAFPLMCHLCPQLVVDDPQALEGALRTPQLLRAFVFSVKMELTKWQAFAVMIDPERPTVDFALLGAPTGSPSAKGGNSSAPIAGGGVGGMGVPAPAAGSPPVAPVTPTVPEKHRQSDADIEAAVKGLDVSPDAAQFSGRSLFTRLAPVRPVSGVHRGLDLRVRPRQTFAEDDSPAWEIGVDGRAHLRVNSKCKSLEEWETSFLDIALAAPSVEGGKVLLAFRTWFCLRAEQFGFKVMLEFYDFLMHLVSEEKSSMEMAKVTLVWQDFQLRNMSAGVDLFTPSGNSKKVADERPSKVPKVAKAPPVAPPSAKKSKGKYCYNFNKQKGCSYKACAHPHVCSGCGGGHPVFECPKTKEAWDSFGKPKHDSSFVPGPVDIGGKPVPVTASTRWPALLDQLWAKTSAVSLEAAGTSVQQWQEFMSELREAGASVPAMTSQACRMAAAFLEDPDCVYLVRGAACGVGFPFSQVPEDTFYSVENYVSKEHWLAMQAEILKEKAAGNVVEVRMHWKVQGISAVGIVERERKGVIKFRPVWDYSRPEDVGVNSRIDLVKEKFASVKDAYSLLRPGLWMAKVDLTAAYRSVPVAARYWVGYLI